MSSMCNALNVSLFPGKYNTVQFPLIVFELGTKLREMVFRHLNIDTLLQSGETFDLIIIEIFGCGYSLGFMHKLKPPFRPNIQCTLSMGK